MPITYDSSTPKTREQFSEKTTSHEGHVVAAAVGLMAAVIIGLLIWSLTQLNSTDSPSISNDASAHYESTPRTGLSGLGNGKIAGSAATAAH